MPYSPEIADYLGSSLHDAGEVFAKSEREEVAVETAEAQVNGLQEKTGKKANEAARVFIAEA